MVTVNEDRSEAGAAQAVRRAFGGGISLSSAAVFLEARDAGLGWEQATVAVAAGLADYYGGASSHTRLGQAGKYRGVANPN